MSLKLSHKAFILVSIPVLFELLLVGSLWYLKSQVELERAREAHSREIANTINSILSLHVRRATYVLLGQGGSAELYNKAGEAARQLHKEFDHIGNMVEDHPEEKKKLLRVIALIGEMDRGFTKSQQYYDSGDKTNAASEWAKYQESADELFDLADKLQGRNKAQIEDHEEKLEFYETCFNFLFWCLISGSVAIAFGLAAYFNSTTSNRFNLLMDSAHRLSAGLEPRASLAGNDELAVLDGLLRELSDSLNNLRRRERAILENAEEVICSMDGDLRFIELNQATLSVWGYEPDDLLGTRVVEFFAEATRGDIFLELDAARTSKNNADIKFETAIERGDGGEGETAWSVKWSEEDQEFYCVVHDITERKKLDRMKQEFVAMVSHDLRTPLTTVQLVHEFIEEEAKEKLSEFAVNELATVKDNISRLIALINNLLDLEKLESGNMEVALEKRELATTVEEATKALASLGRRRRIDLVNAVPKGLFAYYDHERIVQVLVNLLSNALKYSPSAAEIKVEAERRREFIRVTVSDRGPGIPEDLIETIFEKFKQASRDDERIHKGSGLGLAICQRIVECHFGQIGVDSTVGEGSSFWFTLPSTERAAGMNT